MQLADNGAKKYLLSSLVALLCAAWLWVFLGPMEKLGLLVNAQSFTPVFLILFIAQMIPLQVIRFLAGIAASIGYVMHYYSPSNLGLVTKVRYLIAQEWSQLQSLMHGASLADPLQTQLFLFVVCVMYWLIMYASRRTRLWAFYNILAVIVLGIVDGNTPVHPNFAIVAILFICVSVLGITHFARLQMHIVQNERGPARFFAPLSALLVVTMVVGWVFPKQAAVWPNPSHLFRQTGSGDGTGHSIQTIGYQSNNEHLGGAFLMNHDPVLTVVTKYPMYLRGQAYDFYSGKGWNPVYGETESFGTGVPLSAFAGTVTQVKSQLVTQQVTVVSDALHANAVFGAYVLDKVQKVSGIGMDNSFAVNQESGAVFAQPLQKNDAYTVQSNEMVDPSAYLSALPALSSDQLYGGQAGIQNDLQLPPNLPSRVHALATQIIQGAKNENEMVQRIRDYLQSNYQYDTQNVPVPAANQDYVDQFLFESKIGYCNNFSSALAVMLRTVGIPTRWVTGFDKGSPDPNYSGPDGKFIIENADAHSWVEVYFPNVGFIPFDPTPNFSMPFLPDQTSPSGIDSSKPSSPSVNKPIHPPLPQADSGSSGVSATWQAIAHTIEWVFGILAGAAILLGLAFRKRIREARHKWVWRGASVSGMTRAFHHLVKLLRRYGEIPDRENTLRDLHPVAKSYGIAHDEYVHMVRTAESNWYGGVLPHEEDVQRVRSTWIKWVLRVLRR